MDLSHPGETLRRGLDAALTPLQEAKNNFMSMTSLNTGLPLSYRTESSTTDDDCPLELPPVQLEALAATFQEQLMNTGKVQDRQLRNRPVPRSFQGNHAVDTLLQLLRDQSGLHDVTRHQAVQAGRQIQTVFSFFINHKSTAKRPLKLQDSDQELYQFDCNLPMQVFEARRQYPSPYDRVTLLENRVPLSDHRGFVGKIHPNTFLAKEAVDVFMEAKLVKSRLEAVHLMKKLNERILCCRLADHPGSNGSNFKDDNGIYLFVPKEERIVKPDHHHKGSRSKSPKKQNSKGRAHSPMSDHSGKRSPLRRNKTVDGDKPRSLSPNHHHHNHKDAAYFKNRAQGVRSKLDQHRQERANSPMPPMNKDGSGWSH